VCFSKKFGDSLKYKKWISYVGEIKMAKKKAKKKKKR